MENEAGGTAPNLTTGTPTSTINPGRGGRGRGWGKRTSKIWNDFDLIVEYDDDENTVEHGVSKKYKHTYNASSSNGTNHMRNTFSNVPAKVLILTLPN